MCQYDYGEPSQIIYGSVWSNVSPPDIPERKPKKGKGKKEPMGFYQRSRGGKHGKKDRDA